MNKKRGEKECFVVSSFSVVDWTLLRREALYMRSGHSKFPKQEGGRVGGRRVGGGRVGGERGGLIIPW